MYRFVFPLLVLGCAAGAARADVITQSFDYDWDTDNPHHAFAFDDADGTRQLTAVRLGFDGAISMEITSQTYEPTAIPAGEWSAEVSHTVVAFFNGGDEGLDLLQGIGGQWADGITGDLGAGTGDEPGTPYVFTQTIDFANVVEIDAGYFADFAGQGPLTGFMDAFFDGFVIPPASGQSIEMLPTLLAQAGTVTLTYEYSAVVPEPAGAFAIALLATLALRRRGR